jgi:hypothetical protein
MSATVIVHWYRCRMCGGVFKGAKEGYESLHYETQIAAAGLSERTSLTWFHNCDGPDGQTTGVGDLIGSAPIDWQPGKTAAQSTGEPDPDGVSKTA